MRKIIILTILLLSIFGFWENCSAIELIIPDYPALGANNEALQDADSFGGVVKYIYLFALGISGLVALLFMMIGGIMYITSAGNPGKMNDAKDRIVSALLGIVLLLSSVLILRTINPNLVEFGGPNLDIIDPGPGGGGGSGGIGWACYFCHPPAGYSDPQLWCNYNNEYTVFRFCTVGISKTVAETNCSALRDVNHPYWILVMRTCP